MVCVTASGGAANGVRAVGLGGSGARGDLGGSLCPVGCGAAWWWMGCLSWADSVAMGASEGEPSWGEGRAGARGTARRGLMARRSALRADSAAMLANPARGRTRCAACGSSAQTTAANQITKRACPSAGPRPGPLRFSPPRKSPTPGHSSRADTGRSIDRHEGCELCGALRGHRRSHAVQQRCLRCALLFQGWAGLRQAQPERLGAVIQMLLRLFALCLFASCRPCVLPSMRRCLVASLGPRVVAGLRHRRSIPVRAGAGTVACACEAPRSAVCPAAGLPKDRPAS